jgi:hypothetical protein
MKSAIAIALVLCTIFEGCSNQGKPVATDPNVASSVLKPNDEIRRAIQAHLAHNGNLNLNSFDTEVKQVTLAGDNAKAQVEFHVKNGPGTMQLTYNLAKRDGAWSVVESTPAGSNFSHPALDKTPTPALGGTTAGDSAIFRALDNFHRNAPPLSQNLQPGHPPK